MNIIKNIKMLATVQQRRISIGRPLPRIELMDGTTLSVQARDGAYCIPKADLPLNQYTHFEVGFPSREIPEIMRYAEDPSDPTGTVYGYVPIGILKEVFDKAGGIKQLVKR